MDILNELQNFFDYIQHLSEVFIKLNKYNSPNDFINKHKEQTSNNFLLDNLFWFDKVKLDDDNKYKIEISEVYNSVTDKLYHYTSFETLEKIITGSSLKLNNLTNMNDSKEGRAFIEYFQKINLKNPRQNIYFQEAIKLVPQYIPKIFSFSFSALNDDAAQWARYSTSQNTKTKTPYGVCIEFSKEKLLNLISQIPSLSISEITPVLYVPDYKIDNIFLQIVYAFAITAFKNDTGSADISKPKIREKLAEYLSFYSADIKHDSFKSERELRLIISLKNIPECITCGSIFLSLLQNNKTVLPDLIRSITAGPCPEDYKEEYTETIKNLLKRNKLDDMSERVRESNCPLR